MTKYHHKREKILKSLFMIKMSQHNDLEGRIDIFYIFDTIHTFNSLTQTSIC